MQQTIRDSGQSDFSSMGNDLDILKMFSGIKMATLNSPGLTDV